MAWPPDVADGQIIAASHINALKNSVATWPGPVNGNGQGLANAGLIWTNDKIGIGTSTPGALLHIAEAFSAVGNVQNYVPPLSMGLGINSNLSGGQAEVTFFNCFTTETGTVFVFRRKTGATTSTEICAILSDSLRIINLRASNPGAATKQLWYDPADGNRVKFAP